MQASAVTVGLLAHVDAGKTTLAERLLFQGGAIRRLGRVDHQDTFLDTHALERERGITIFSKQAVLELEGKTLILLDTPGHVDFSSEMERTLQVLDYAVLIVSAPDGVTGHVTTLWRLLAHYRVPVFVFVNKMDQPGTDREKVLEELRAQLGDGFAPMSAGADEDETFEEMAVGDEEALEEYLETGKLCRDTMARLIRERKVFPCCFGSALKGEGTEFFMQTLASLTEYPRMPDSYAARVFKISREKGIRLTWLRMMGGTLKVKEPVRGEEKADQLRIYNGVSFRSVEEVRAGQICAVAGPAGTFAGEGLGLLRDPVSPSLESVISYGLILPEGVNPQEVFRQLRQLEEEMPELHVAAAGSGDGAGGGAVFMVRVMGEVQVGILRTLLKERFGLDAVFGEGQIVYKETIASPVVGSGHYEPLRHYAEVHLLLEPGEAGCGITFASACHTDELDLNWQRLIGTHVLEKAHTGVLTGSELTDVRVTLLAGRAHLKHTEGGDFREATYRAIRQGLMKAENVLLEPVFRFRMELPLALAGHALADIQKMQGTFEGPVTGADGSTAVITGEAPVSGMMRYDSELREYTHGTGRISLENGGYRPCPDAESVIQAFAYDPDADTANPSGSVFCSHGAGIFVPWNEAGAKMHLRPGIPAGAAAREGAAGEAGARAAGERPGDAGRIDDEELMAIFTRTYGEIRRDRAGRKKDCRFDPPQEESRGRRKKKGPERPPLLLVDGYNVIHAWKGLKELADENLDAARARLTDILSNFRGYRQMTLILVFDAYKVPGAEGEVMDCHGIHVVYTKEAETADAYIEKAVHRLAGEYDVTVATSDGAEQLIIWGEGARRMTAAELEEEVDLACREIRARCREGSGSGKRYLFSELPAYMRDLLESMRLGKQD